jgi:chemotaxis protein MotB
MIFDLRAAARVIPLCLLVLSACVSQQAYNALENAYNQLNQQLSGEIAQQQVRITRLQGAIKVAVNSDLLFPSGSWQMPPQAAQLISRMAPILAPFQQTKIIVTGYTDNVPVGPELRAGGREQPAAIAETGADRRQFPRLTGGQPEPGLGARPWGC